MAPGCPVPSQVHFTLQYEPYVIVRRSDSPIYDERFLQRFFNKVVHLYALYVRRSVREQCTPVGVQLVHEAVLEQGSLPGVQLVHRSVLVRCSLPGVKLVHGSVLVRCSLARGGVCIDRKSVV